MFSFFMINGKLKSNPAAALRQKKLRVSEMLSTDIIDYDFDKCTVLVVRKGGDKDIVSYSEIQLCNEFL